MAGDKVCLGDQIRRQNRVGPETQMRRRNRPRLLRIVDKVALRKSGRLRTNDLDRVLVRADRPIRTQPIKQSPHCARVFGRKIGVERQAGVGHIVVDADREVILHLRLVQLIEDALGHRRRKFLRRKAIASADNPRLPGKGRRPARHRFAERGHYILVQGLAQRARLLGAVQYGNRLHGPRQRSEEGRCVKWPVQPHLQQPELLALRVEVLDRLLHRAGA